MELQLHSPLCLHSVHEGNFTFAFLPSEIVKLTGFTLPRTNALLTNPKVKGNVLAAQAMQVYWRSRGIPGLTLNLCTIRRWEVNMTPRQIYPPEKLRHPFSKKMGGPQSRSGRFEEEKNILPLPGFELWTAQPIAQVQLYILMGHGKSAEWLYWGDGKNSSCCLLLYSPPVPSTVCEPVSINSHAFITTNISLYWKSWRLAWNTRKCNWPRRYGRGRPMKLLSVAWIHIRSNRLGFDSRERQELHSSPPSPHPQSNTGTLIIKVPLEIFSTD